jgi:hypothetical protein
VEEKAEVMFGAEWEARVIERFCRSVKNIVILTLYNFPVYQTLHEIELTL